MTYNLKKKKTSIIKNFNYSWRYG